VALNAELRDGKASVEADWIANVLTSKTDVLIAVPPYK
jgi:hypothetical protein